MAESSEPPSPENARPHRLETWTELAGAVILSIAALLTSWASFQAELWDGDQAAAYSQAESVRTEASRLATRAGQIQGGDMLMFTNWLSAFAAEDEALQDFYEQNFRAGFRTTHAEWLALQPMKNPSAPRTPFSMPSYQITHEEQARVLEERANAFFLEGQEANRNSDGFVRVTVILAGALFFGGIGQVFRIPRVRVALVVVAAISCVWGVVQLLGLPVN
ncbi:hypothetical protein [Brevundimonas lenta]|uniref:DUF4337 domain-containing protein n=1 Tax=Brevundimonas lenta TaxID=424796 RepID=A0A7W6JB41_9CAUL|nr:hypothetical protein [Brevundimonas lenta]MBB4081817.1 hypothetical protein [Brevundimonas lenta]